MTGLCVLNVGAGDITVAFDDGDPGERAKAIKMLKDMRARGYLFAIKLPDGSYTKAVDIDGEHGGHYIVVVPDDLALPPDAAPVEGGKRPRRGRRVALPIDKTEAYGVARSAGG
jgi:hypothetical protein